MRSFVAIFGLLFTSSSTLAGGLCAQSLLDNTQIPNKTSVQSLSFNKESLEFLKLAALAEKPDASIETRIAYRNSLHHHITLGLRQLVADVLDITEFKVLGTNKTSLTSEGSDKNVFKTLVKIQDLSTNKIYSLQITNKAGQSQMQLKLIFDRMAFIKDNNVYLEFRTGSALDEKTGLNTPHHKLGFLSKKFGLSLEPSLMDSLAYSMNKDKSVSNAVLQVFGFYYMTITNPKNLSLAQTNHIEKILEFTQKSLAQGHETIPTRLLTLSLALHPQAREVIANAIQTENTALKTVGTKPSLDRIVSTLKSNLQNEQIGFASRLQIESYIGVLKNPTYSEAYLNHYQNLHPFQARATGEHENHLTSGSESTMIAVGQKQFEKIIEDLLEIQNPKLNGNGDIIYNP